MTDSATLDLPAIIDRYVLAWNAPDDERNAILNEVFARVGYYCDGIAEATGHDAISAMIEATLTQFPGAAIELMSPVDAHHRQARFAWRLRDAEGTTIVDGIDVVRVDDAGRLTNVLGFFGVSIAVGSSTSLETFNWERTYPVSASRLFAVVADNALFAQIAPNLASVDAPATLEVGTVRTCHDPAGNAWTETYTDWVDGERFATRVDIDTYPDEMKAMIKALDASWTITANGPAESTLNFEITAELTDTGVQVFREGGGADATFVPMLDGWTAHLESENGPT